MTDFALRTTDTSDQINHKNIPLFYKDFILFLQGLYRKVNVFKNNTPEIIWCNHELQFNGKPLAYRHSAKSGINMINNIIENIVLKESDSYNNLGCKAGFSSEMFALKCCIANEWIDKTVDLDMPPNETIEQSILDAMI